MPGSTAASTRAAHQKKMAHSQQRRTLIERLNAGERILHQVLAEAPEYLENYPIHRLVCAYPGMGSARTDRLLLPLGIDRDVKLVELSGPQWKALLQALETFTPPSPGGAPSSAEDQRMQALGLANHSRTARAELRRGLKSGRLDVVDVLREPSWPATRMPIGAILIAQHQWGKSAVRKTLQKTKVRSHKSLEELTPRQREAIIEQVILRRQRITYRRQWRARRAEQMQQLAA